MAHHSQSKTNRPGESDSRLKAIIDTAIDGIITIDKAGIIDTMNPAAARMFGYDAEEVIGKNVSILMPEPDRSIHNTYIQKYLETGEGKIIGIGREVTGLKKNGKTFPFRLAISEMQFDNQRMFTGIIHDLTPQKQAEERLRRYAVELERSNRDLQDFAYISSHDLQEPLRKIRTFGSRLLLKEEDNLSDTGKDYLNRVLSAAERMQRLINDLLSFSRISTQALPFRKVKLSLILDEVLSDLELMLQQNGAAIYTDPLPEIDADPTQMRQLFQNLISNALKFRKSEVPPSIQVKTRMLSKQEVKSLGLSKEWVEISIADNGIGFDKKYADKIFNIFQRLEGNKYEGSGIGLTICKRIVTSHGGMITVQSEEEKGTTFYVLLPIIQNGDLNHGDLDQQNPTQSIFDNT